MAGVKFTIRPSLGLCRGDPPAEAEVTAVADHGLRCATPDASHSSRLSVRGMMVEPYGREESTLHGYREKLSAVIAELGDIAVQKLSKRHIDDLVGALRTGGLKSPTDKVRKPWTPRSVNYLLGLLTAVMEGEAKQGHVVRNVAALVDRIPADPKKPKTLTPAQVEAVLNHTKDDRYAVAWQLALAGLRRGAIAGMRWDNIDLEAKTLKVAPTRLRFGKTVLIKDDPKTAAGERTLPLPDHLLAALKSARALQAADRLATVTHTRRAVMWSSTSQRGAESARVDVAVGANAEGGSCPNVRLHDARHTCGTLMHLYDSVPAAVIAAWLGHANLELNRSVDHDRKFDDVLCGGGVGCGPVGFKCRAAGRVASDQSLK